MIDEVLAAASTVAGLAAGGVVQAAGTDLWTGFRTRMGAVFGRRGAGAGQAALERLDETAAALARASGPGGDLERVREAERAHWNNRVLVLLAGLPEEDLPKAMRELRGAAESVRRPHAGPSAGTGGLAVTGDVSIRADHGTAVGVVNGGVHLTSPRQPGPAQG
ncbi:hypothetical protein ACFVHB_24290 [Kitasatospora sp. NPDC127111]|uniref:hypothetical protein n=1 Tax=Kitasatospora sp. NPDC127111 TaxID=3345363 RepID=UPI003640C4F6